MPLGLGKPGGGGFASLFSGGTTKKKRSSSSSSSSSTMGKAASSSSSSSSSSSASSSSAAAAAKKQKQKAYTQTYLDFGQKSHGTRTMCGQCGMLYVNGEAEDERDHANFCRNVNAGLIFQGWKAERLVWGAQGKDKVVEVRPTDGTTQLHKIGEVKRIMDQEMGFVPLAEGEKALGPTEKAFLYVHEKRVVGCLIAEKIATAHPVLEAMPHAEAEKKTAPSACTTGRLKKEEDKDKDKKKEEEEEGHAQQDDVENQQPLKGAVEDTHNQEAAKCAAPSTAKAASTKAAPAPPPHEDGTTSLLPKGVAYSLDSKEEAALGIKQIWVSKNSRRQGIAKRMVEAARARFYYGFVVPREKVAFSQLSNAGYSFAQSYMEQGVLLVY